MPSANSTSLLRQAQPPLLPLTLCCTTRPSRSCRAAVRGMRRLSSFWRAAATCRSVHPTYAFTELPRPPAAVPRHTRHLPAVSPPQRCSFFYWLRVCECCAHVCRSPLCIRRVMFVTLTVFCSTEERALQRGVQLAAGGSLPRVQNHPATSDTAPQLTYFFRAA
jgi:hypothetical protein